MQTEQTMTLEQAGLCFGVGADALQRLIRVGGLPEARKEVRSWGRVWVIEAEALPVIAQRQGWTLDLTGDEPVATADETVVVPTPAGPRPDPGLGPTPDVGSTRDPGSALIPRSDGTPDPSDDDQSHRPEGAPSMHEVVDMQLLDRLLGVQEERIHAVAEASHTRRVLESVSDDLDQVKAELEVERRELRIASDRAKDERMARAASEAKVAELRDRVMREMALAESEKEARADAVDRSLRAERDAAAAVAAMGWRARRRYRRRVAELD